MKLTTYLLPPLGKNIHIRAAVAADLHGKKGTESLRILDRLAPDMILIPGDLANRFCIPPEFLRMDEWRAYRNGMAFLRSAAEIAPVYYSLGNHEMGGIHSGNPVIEKNFPSYRPLDESLREEILDAGVHLLDDSYVMHGKVAIGGLTSALTYDNHTPNLSFLKEFDALDAPKILLCHHPEYYPRYVRETSVNLMISGHAHGGHWSFFGKAVFAPGQGLFPTLVRGVYENRLVVSRGMSNNTFVPRIGVPRELLQLEIGCPYDRA